MSAVLANTPAGECALESLMRSGRIVLEPVPLDTIAKGNPRLLDGCYAIPANRRAFLDGVIAGRPFDYLWTKHGPNSVSKWRAWWTRYRSSDARPGFLIDSVLRLLQRFTNQRA